jgi:hypothetical protein
MGLAAFGETQVYNITSAQRVLLIELEAIQHTIMPPIRTEKAKSL